MGLKLKKGQRYHVVCYSCEKEYDENETYTRCPDASCDGPLDIQYDYEQLAQRLNKFDLRAAPAATQKYLDFFPIKDYRNVVSLQEGGTPLYKVEHIGKKFGLKNLYVKNEGQNPTGVFKDRGTLVEIAKAIELGAKAVMVASSGNMAASCAAYASKAGLPIYILVPENRPIGKLSQMLSYGGHVIKIRGGYAECIHLVQKLAPKHGFYLAGDYVFRREGQKSLAYELCEEFNFEAPDVVICPTGAGTHIAGIWKGFEEYRKLGFIKKVPKMVAVQAEGAAVLVESFSKHKHTYKAWSKTDTICSAVAVADPIDGVIALDAAYKTKGCVVAASDNDALKAQNLLASKEGIFSEPSSALAIAILPSLIKSGFIKKNDVVVAIATGNGLKDPLTPLQNLPTPKTLEADFKTVSRYIKSVRK